MKKSMLLRDASSLPKWFPLKIYSAHLAPQQWLEALVARWAVMTQYRNTQDQGISRDAFTRVIVRQSTSKAGRSKLLASTRKPGELLGVRELPAFDAAYIGSMLAHSKNGAALISEIKSIRNTRDSKSLWIEPSPRIKKARRQSFAELVDNRAEPYRMSDVLSGVAAVIDLDQDDESLVFAFKFWLRTAREILGPARRPIGIRDFSAWRDYGVLPVFDLKLWGELHDARYSETLIADTLWPHAHFDNVERLRKVTRPKVNEIFGDSVLVGRLWRQLELEASLEKITRKTSTPHSNPALLKDIQKPRDRQKANAHELGRRSKCVFT